MESAIIVSFLGTAILLTLMPGPDILFVIAQSISQDVKAGIVTACGLCTGLLVHITAAVLGISALIYSSSAIFSIVKFAGAAYMLYLAFCAFRAGTSSVHFSEKSAVAYGKLYQKGIIMNLLNPKVSLFFLALLPQFIQGRTNVPEQMVVLGSIFLAQALFIFSVASLLAGRIGSWLTTNLFLSMHLHKLERSLLAFIGGSIAFSDYSE